VYLKKLDIFGFKSFADKVSVDFDSGLTAIVGPNGCGKTNIVDAVRWAIGEQKASVLRSSTMENVIFNGTNNRKALGFAEVSLTVENTKGILPSEYSEITITRRCFRDGTSNYMLNGANCRLKDITALFMDTGMGSDAYSVIELKMVNDILSHRTQDRRKLFEEASGITKYKERRRESLYKLEIAKESITEANIEIRNRQRTVNAYERIVAKQQEAKEISESLKVLEIDYHQRCYSKLIDDTSSIEEELKTKEEDRVHLQRRLNENENVILGFREELLKIEKSLNEKREELTSANLKISEVHSSISIAKQRMKHLQENIERFQKEKVEIESQMEKLHQNKKEDEDKINVLNETIRLLEDSLITKKKSLDEYEEKVKSSKDELKDLTQKHASASKSLTSVRSEYDIANLRLDDQISRCTKLTEENIADIGAVNDIDRQSNELQSQVSSLNSLLTKSNLELEQKNREKENLNEEIQSAEKEFIYKNLETEKLKNKIEFHENLLKTFDDYSEGVKHLVKEKGEANAKIVIDSLEVDDKFKVAIETALGEISNYLIVEDFISAEKLIQNLKDGNRGKVTFILNNTLFDSSMNIFQDEFPEILKHEGVYGWADKFVKPPKEHEILFKYLLDEYIIVENFDTAVKLANDSFIKFITLDGDIVTKGFIRAGSKTSDESIKIGRESLIIKLREQREEFESEAKRSESNLSELKNNHDAIDTATIAKETEAKKDELNQLKNKLSQLAYIKEQKNKSIENNTKLNEKLVVSNRELGKTIDGLMSGIEKAENEKYQLEKELEHFTTELEELADELTQKRDEYSNFKIEVTKVKGELMNYENELARTNFALQNADETIASKTIECEDYAREILSLGESIEGNLVDDGLLKQLKHLEEVRDWVESEFSVVKTDYDLKRTNVDSIESDIRIQRTERDSLVDFIHSNEMQLTKGRIEMKEHKEKVREEYELEIEYKDFEDKHQYDFIRSKAEVDRLRHRLRQLGGSGQMELGIYEQEKKELERMLFERDDLIKAEEDLVNLIEQINITANQKFTETFELIRQNFQSIFRELFMEGDEADLKLVVDEDNPDPLDAKIDIIAKPRGKRPQLIDLLSGGEKTLTAIALLFAIYQVKPSPFCILDEVDAPLDDANIDRFVKIIRKFAEETQFVIVTHNKRTMEASDSMYGVTMAEQGISTIVNVKFSEVHAAAS